MGKKILSSVNISHLTTLICSLYQQLPVNPTSFIYRATTSPDQTWLIAAICSHSCSSSPIKPLYEAAKCLLPLPTAAVSFFPHYVPFWFWVKSPLTVSSWIKTNPNCCLRSSWFCLWLCSVSIFLLHWDSPDDSEGKRVGNKCFWVRVGVSLILGLPVFSLVFSLWPYWHVTFAVQPFFRVKTLRMLLRQLSWVQSCLAKKKI